MSNKVLLFKLVKNENQTDELYEIRKSLYEKAIDKHNMMIWSTLHHSSSSDVFHTHLKEYNNVNFFPSPGTLVNFEGLAFYDNRFKQYNPYFDSGFDIFQPADFSGDTKLVSSSDGKGVGFEVEGSYLVKLGFKSAMYTLVSNSKKDYKRELLRQITIYHNLNNISDETLGEYTTKRFNMVQKTDWHNMIPMPYKLHPRSSIYKKAIRQANCTGIIDTGYRGELCAAVDCLGYAYGKQSDELRTSLEHGKRYFQICRADLQPFYIVLLNEQDELPSTERGEGGFGSTGR